jgi:hypothetical protein
VLGAAGAVVAFGLFRGWDFGFLLASFERRRPASSKAGRFPRPTKRSLVALLALVLGIALIAAGSIQVTSTTIRPDLTMRFFPENGTMGHPLALHMPYNRYNFRTIGGDDALYVLGGIYSSIPTSFIDTVYRMNPFSNETSLVSHLPAGSQYVLGTFVDGRIVVLDYSITANPYLNRTMSWLPGQSEWIVCSTPTNHSLFRYDLQAWKNHALLVNPVAFTDARSWNFTHAVYLVDAGSGELTRVSSTPVSMNFTSSCPIDRGLLVVNGSSPFGSEATVMWIATVSVGAEIVDVSSITLVVVGIGLIGLETVLVIRPVRKK